MSNRNVLDTDAWHFVERYPPQFLGTPTLAKMFRDWVSQARAAREGFGDRLRAASLQAISIDDPEWIRRGLQCLAWVGEVDDLKAVRQLATHPDIAVSRDAITCEFEISHRPADD